MLQSEVCHEFKQHCCALPRTSGSATPAKIAVIYYLNLSFLYKHLLEGKKKKSNQTKNPTSKNKKNTLHVSITVVLHSPAGHIILELTLLKTVRQFQHQIRTP